MTSFVQSLTMTYLLWPQLGLLLVGLGVFIAKKNALLSNKHLIGYFFGAVIVLTVPALAGFLDYDFMPYGYFALAFIYLILGSYNTRLVAWVFNNDYKYRHELTLTIFLQVTAMLFFVFVFNLCNELQYGLWASTCMLSFLFISFFVKSYHLYLHIPDAIDFGVWVKQLIEDYNKNSPLSPIKHTNAGKPDDWIFYHHNSILLPKRYIACFATIKENHIREIYLQWN